MKALLLTHRGDDYLASCLWDGAQELLGEDNVYDAVGNPGLHYQEGVVNPCTRISGSRVGKTLGDEGDFDLFIINACFLREFDWTLAGKLRERLRPGAKIAFVEGWDSAHETHAPPPWMMIGNEFRREYDPAYPYPFLKVWPLSFAAPARWFEGAENSNRPWDCFFAGAMTASELRWEMLAKVFSTRCKHNSMLCSNGMGDDYWKYLRQSKIGLCPPGAANSVPLRAFEIIACGAIPFFVGLPNWIREPWFDCETFTLDNMTMALGAVLSCHEGQIENARIKCLKHSLKHHATKARVEQMLGRMGL